jgi:hypothetical protein
MENMIDGIMVLKSGNSIERDNLHIEIKTERPTGTLSNGGFAWTNLNITLVHGELPESQFFKKMLIIVKNEYWVFDDVSMWRIESGNYRLSFERCSSIF